MPLLKTQLQNSLDGARRVAILAVGSALRGDDAAGTLAGQELAALLTQRRKHSVCAEPSAAPPAAKLPPATSPATKTLLAAPPSAKALPAKVFFGHAAPENLTGAIRQFRPTHLLILDAADFGARPGAVRLLAPETVDSIVPASTHALPLSVLADFLARTVPCQVAIVAIQPRRTELGGQPSHAVHRAAKLLAAAILSSINSTVAD